MIKYITIIFFPILFLLSACGTIQSDCTTLVGDRDAYRHCAADQGNKVAQYELGLAAYDAQDFETAIGWLRRSARPKASQNPAYLEQQTNSRRDLAFEEDMNLGLPGHEGAQRLLVKIYEEGIGVAVNLKEAERYREMINPQ